MATNDQMRIFKLEQRLLRAEQLVGALQTQLAQVAQNQFAATIYGGGGGGASQPFFCTPPPASAGATGPPATGTPGGPLTGQSLYQIGAGAFSNTTSSAQVYNGMQSGIVVTKTVICLANTDGTYTAVSQSCV